MTRREITENRIVRNIMHHNYPGDNSEYNDLYIASKSDPYRNTMFDTTSNASAKFQVGAAATMYSRNIGGAKKQARTNNNSLPRIISKNTRNQNG